MADIFEIKDIDVKIKIDEVLYDFVDPNFFEKVSLQKKYQDAFKRKDSLDVIDFETEIYMLNCEHIKLFCPTINDDLLKKMGEFKVQLLLEKILDLAKNKFGAVVEKVEKK